MHTRFPLVSQFALLALGFFVLLQPRVRGEEEGIAVEAVAVENESEAGGGETEGETDGWVTVDIPQIGGSIKMPPDWHRPTAEQAIQALDYIEHKDQEERARAEMSALAIGRTRVSLSKHPEPHPDLNPMIDITWDNLPPIFEQVPADKKGLALAQVISTSILPVIKKDDEAYRLLEGPKAMQNGAWVTFKHGTKLKDGRLVESIVRVTLILSGKKLLIVALILPADKAEAEEVMPTLWRMFTSLEHGKQ